MSYQDKILICEHTSYHRGPFFYKCTRETAKCIFVRRVLTITENEHGDGTYHTCTITGVGDMYGPEYRLLKKDDENGIYFRGKANHIKAEKHIPWDGKPRISNEYY